MLAALLAIGCHDPNLVTGPSPIAAALTADDPTLGTEGVSCPSQAPTVRVSSFHGRLDVDWQGVPEVFQYEVTVQEHHAGSWRQIAADQPSGTHYETRPGSSGLYRARVRSLRCNGTGDWSAWVEHRIDSGEDGTRPAPPAPDGPSLPTEGRLIAVAETSHVFLANVPAASAKVVAFDVPVPAGTYTVRITTRDAGHATSQQHQQFEQLTGVLVGVVAGTTPDIPEDATEVTGEFVVTIPTAASHVLLLHAAHPIGGPNSVHGARVEVWTR